MKKNLIIYNKATKYIQLDNFSLIELLDIIGYVKSCDNVLDPLIIKDLTREVFKRSLRVMIL